MNRTQRAIIKAAREHLDMSREFKNDALESRLKRSFYSQIPDRFKGEKEMFKSAQLELRRLKKYNGPTGAMSENDYKEFMGA